MANQEQLDRLLKEGVQVWNEWREENPDIHINLDGAVLDGAILNGVNLRYANLDGANLTYADLTNANFTRANLTRATLRYAYLDHATLRFASLDHATLRFASLDHATLSHADFSGANLAGANLSHSRLIGGNFFNTDLSDVIFEFTIFGDVDLSTVKGLETVEHEGPSTIGIDTIIRSQGKIPEIFLRGAGVPPSIIEAIPSLIGSLKPIDFYSCFISYSSKDQDFAKRLYADLQAKGVRCWLDKEDLKIGEKFRPRIDEAIRRHDKLLLVLSQHSVKSDWVEKEVETAFEKERQYKKFVLFPIRLDEAVIRTRQAWAADIRRQRHIGDFTCWKDHDAYQKVFSRLLRDLKAETPSRL